MRILNLHQKPIRKVLPCLEFANTDLQIGMFLHTVGGSTFDNIKPGVNLFCNLPGQNTLPRFEICLVARL